VGNVFDVATAEGDLKTAALLEGMERMGYRVVNIGERDVRMGYDDFKRRTEKSKLTFISANIVRHDTKQPVFQPHALLDIPAAEGKRRIKVGVVGALRYNSLFLRAGPAGSNMLVDQPKERVAAEVQALRAKGAEIVVLLAAMSKDDVTALVQQVPGIDFALGAYGGVWTDSVERVGDTTVSYCANKGQRMGELRVFIDEKTRRLSHSSGRLHYLTAVYPSDQAMLEFVNAVPVKAATAAPAAARPGAPGGGAR
jgi:2',3'-cyclic-nucleotide 2'-phosphodiesterase (5'-nucleotidase family)